MSGAAYAAKPLNGTTPERGTVVLEVDGATPAASKACLVVALAAAAAEPAGPGGGGRIKGMGAWEQTVELARNVSSRETARSTARMASSKGK